jgi:alpha-D-ribose 1-methylphosphonate 5-triphosphate diphosphatase PhnM
MGLLKARGLLPSGDVQHLTAFVVATGRACHVAWDGCAALRAALEDGGAPAVSSLTEALTALGLSAFWIGHVRKGSLFQLIEGIPDSAVSSGLFVDQRFVCRFEVALSRTVAQINVAIFTAREVRKG